MPIAENTCCIKPKKLLLDHELLLLHGLLLPLKLIQSSLNLCKCSYDLLCLACLVLPHPLKYG